MIPSIKFGRPLRCYKSLESKPILTSGGITVWEVNQYGMLNFYGWIRSLRLPGCAAMISVVAPHSSLARCCHSRIKCHEILLFLQVVSRSGRSSLVNNHNSLTSVLSGWGTRQPTVKGINIPATTKRSSTLYIYICNYAGLCRRFYSSPCDGPGTSQRWAGKQRRFRLILVT